MNKKLKKFICLVITAISIASYGVGVKAIENEVGESVSTALRLKTFYHFNNAYAKVIAMPETAEKYQYLSELSSIQDVVWTKDINNILNLLTELTKTSSARKYSEIENYIMSANLNEWDKGYLGGELTSWGRKLVWTEDFAKAIEAVIKANTESTEENVAIAEKLIASVKVEENKQYLSGELNLAKQKVFNTIEDPLKEIIKLNKNQTMTRDERVAKMIAIAKANKGLEIPQQYLEGAGIYAITDAVASGGLRENITLEELQRTINNYIAMHESSKFINWFGRGNNRPKVSISDEAIEEKILALEAPLLPETKVTIEGAGWQRGGPDVPFEPSEYLYIKDQKIYVKNSSVPSNGYTDSVNIKVQYKNGGSSTNLWVSLTP